MFHKRSQLLLLILFIALLIYSPSFKNPFIWDDFHLIVNDADIKSFRNVPIIFKSQLFQNVGGSNFYRPLQTISFMLDYSMWKLKPFGYHLTNVILHLLNIILIYFFASRIFKNKEIGLLTSFIFAIHPINTEAVTYIAGRADPLSCLFFLLAFLLYMRFKDEGKTIILFTLSILFFIFALLTKEAIIIFPLILILYDSLILEQGSVNKKSLLLYTPYFLIIIFYILFRLFVLGLPLGLLGHIPFRPYLLTTSRILILYLGLLFFPINLYMERIEPLIESIFGPQVIVSLITVICIIWFSILIYRRYKNLFFCIGFFFITLLPMLNILPINALMAEHWLYLPSIGIYSCVSFGLIRIIDLRKPFLKQAPLGKFIVVAFIGILSFFSIQAILKNIEWGRPLEFYKNILKHSPYSVRGHLNLAGIYILNKNYISAREELQKASELNAADPFYYHELGVVEYLEKNKKRAINNWKMSLSIAPLYKPTHEVMTKVLYVENKRFRRLLRAVTEKPKNIIGNYRLSKIYLENSLYIEALDRLERILELDPEYVNAIFNRAWVYSKLGIYTKAIKEYNRVVALTPDAHDVYRNLGFCYAALNKHKEAQVMWQKAKALLGKK